MRPEDFKPPLLVSQPRYDTGFDGAEIGIDQDVARGSHKRGADKLRQRVIRRAVDCPQCIELATFDQLTGQLQRLRVGTGQILHLYKTTGPSAGTVGTVKL